MEVSCLHSRLKSRRVLFLRILERWDAAYGWRFERHTAQFPEALQASTPSSTCIVRLPQLLPPRRGLHAAAIDDSQGPDMRLLVVRLQLCIQDIAAEVLSEADDDT